ncbi:MAG TPA: DUF1761 domain-containing protein [Actinomycetota bacterium]
MTFDVLSEINYLAAVVAALAYFAIGALWYSPVLFSKPWQRAIGMQPQEAQSPNPLLFVLTAVAYFVQAVTLGALARATGGTDLMDGLVLGLFVAIGIVAMGLWVNVSYEQRAASLLWINAGNALVGIVVMSIIMTVWD